MILSAQQIFSDDQAITATVISENVIDLGLPSTPFGAVAPLNQDVGKGNPIPILIQVTEDFTHATSSDLTINIEVSAVAGLTSPVVLATETIAFADLIAGKQTFLTYLPKGADLRFLGIRYTSSSGSFTGGKITAGVSMGNQTNLTGA